MQRYWEPYLVQAKRKEERKNKYLYNENGLKFHQDTAVENGIEWFAKKILDTLGDPNAIVGGEDCLYINKNNTLICGNRYEGTVKEALRKIAEEFEIDYQDTWNTQQFGRKIINELK